MSCGIYKITNLLNNKVYIGQSINIEERWKKHKWHSLSVDSYPLYRAFNKYGLNNFSFEILEHCDNSQLDEKEIAYIKLYNSYYEGYNQTQGGQGSSGLFVKLSKEDIFIIYDLLANTNILQKDIALMFDLGEDTISEINNGKTRIDFDRQYPIRNNKRKKHYCQECGSQLHSQTKGNLCYKCIAKTRRIVERPNRNELKQMIRTTPFTRIGEKFGVSDNTIRKWCKVENLPFKAKEIKQYSDQEWEKI